MHLTDYLFDGPANEFLERIGLTGGTMKFEYTKKHRQLWLVTEYDAPRMLNEDEAQVLIEFTIGQWLDGAGEDWGPELREKNAGIAPLCHPEEVYIAQEP